MDPQIKSILTSIGIGLATSAATWAAGVGIIPASAESTLTNALVAGALYLVALVLAWYKGRQHTPVAQIAAVNAATPQTGVKAVSEFVAAPVVREPQK